MSTLPSFLDATKKSQALDAKEVVRQLSGGLNIQEADKNVSRFELRGRTLCRQARGRWLLLLLSSMTGISLSVKLLIEHRSIIK